MGLSPSLKGPRSSRSAWSRFSRLQRRCVQGCDIRENDDHAYRRTVLSWVRQERTQPALGEPTYLALHGLPGPQHGLGVMDQCNVVRACGQLTQKCPLILDADLSRMRARGVTRRTRSAWSSSNVAV